MEHGFIINMSSIFYNIFKNIYDIEVNMNISKLTELYVSFLPCLLASHILEFRRVHGHLFYDDGHATLLCHQLPTAENLLNNLLGPLLPDLPPILCADHQKVYTV